MLEDYRKYLLGIRNNLIQCGVEFPVSPCMEYRELFELGCSLDSLLWYYSVLEISGSEDRLKGFYLPLGNHFKDKMKRVFYEEFQMFLKDYNKLSVRSYLSNPKYKNLENISDIYSNAGENLVKLIDIGVEGSVSTETAESSVGRVEYVECGRYLEDYVEEIEAVEGVEEAEGRREPKKVEGLEFVSNGLYLEDYREVVEDRVEAVENEPRGSVERVSHGLYLEDYVEGNMEESEESDDWLEESDEVAEESDDWLEESEEVAEESDDWLEEEESETEDDLVEEAESDWLEEDEPDSDWVEESEDEPESDWSEEEESEEDWLEEEAEETDDWVEEPESDWLEEDVEDDWVEEPEEEADSDWVEEDESDDWLEEEESEEPEVEADSDWLEEEDSDWVEEPEEEAEEADSDWIEEPESDWVEEEEVPVEPGRVQPKSQGNGSPVGSQPKEKPKTYEKDISDYIQDFTNGLLTSGKRAIIKGLRKLDK